MRYASVCSGIGAPEAAWSGMWGAPEFVSEIDKFPAAVLEHHYPGVPNYGDMLGYEQWPGHELDILIGGTPCQAFSVAGLRRSLEDERGNLTLTFLRIADKYKPGFTIWENVPGVLNTPDNAFGQFLSGLAGFDTELSPTGGRWTGAGFIIGPERVAAWRVLDAQFFGVPQRRRRVFVVASPRKFGFAPIQILFEPHSMQGHPQASGKEGQGATGYTASSIGSYSKGVGSLRANGGDVGKGSETLVMAHGQAGAEVVKDGSPSLTCNHEAPIVCAKVALPLKGESHDSSEDGTGRQNLIVEKKITCYDARGNGEGTKSPTITGDHAGHVSDYTPIVHCIQGSGRTSQGSNGSGRTSQGSNGSGINEDIAFTLNNTDEHAVCVNARQDPITTDDKTQPLDQKGNSQAVALDAYNQSLHDKAHCIRSSRADGEHNGIAFINNAIVRRLTPRECERLQGFPDDYTLIPNYKRFRSKYHAEIVEYLRPLFNKESMTPEAIEKELERMAMQSDSPRYKALGNSMAVPVVRWIGERIKLYCELMAQGGSDG